VPEAASSVDTADTQRDLGRATAALRAKSGLTQEQLADRLGVDPTYVSQVERGRRGVRRHRVMRFRAALEATTHQLAEELETKGAREGSTIPSKARGIARV